MHFLILSGDYSRFLRWLYTQHPGLANQCYEEQYDYDLLEYFDEAGQFHCSPWEISDGFVARSADYDHRNKENPLSYTSLIVDAWPRGSRYGL